jgi:hypothetical protein
MSKNKEKALDYFQRHLMSNECHITSDDRIFHAKGTAESFAATLADTNVDSFTRSEIETESKNSKSAKTEALEFTEDGIKEILENGLVKENYKQLKALVSHLKLDVSDNKCETLVQALTDYKISLQ